MLVSAGFSIAQRPDVLILDLQLPDRSGMEVFEAVHAIDPKLPVIFITAHGTTQTAIEAMKGGAFDYLVKPVDLERLSQVLTRAFEAVRLMSVPAVLPAEDLGDRIVGRDMHRSHLAHHLVHANLPRPRKRLSGLIKTKLSRSRRHPRAPASGLLQNSDPRRGIEAIRCRRDRCLRGCAGPLAGQPRARPDDHA